MGMNHVSKLWNKSDGSKQGTLQSNHMAVAMPTHQTGGSSAKPSMPKNNMAGPTTPSFAKKGMKPIQGTGSGNMKPGKM